ncbi:hypothetical protein BHE90_013051 [Fusarium euwallaceae]|uniref:Uncharacterized protein n=3 Tax=Fusarium solani species complex TaxID=232080 RepID=A0A430LA43_9HYPO|nr:hypothetical protein CEP51_012755 [Fusarium floridanum]RSM17345.1 hypothetical protein CDV31_003761 [Fusarium ambrosium]RTE72525.1 hypothetical protein BHE90_013051 [Fusarium euwallaceae]
MLYLYLSYQLALLFFCWDSTSYDDKIHHVDTKLHLGNPRSVLGNPHLQVTPYLDEDAPQTVTPFKG